MRSKRALATPRAIGPDHVEGDPVQPRSECTVSTKLSNGPVGAYERFLSQIFSLVPFVGHEESHQSVDARLVVTHQGFERHTITKSGLRRKHFI